MQYLFPTPFLAACLIAGMPAWALAQTPAQKPAAETKTPAAAAAKPAAKPVTNPQSSRISRSAQKAVEEVTPIEDDPTIQLSEADLAVAKQIFMGDIPCELGASVRIRPARRIGMFVVTTKGYRFLMHPVESRTGATRLEDPRRGAMWLQLGNKSMLMSQKLGQRLADECQSPEQLTFADELKRNPRPSILDALPPVPTPSVPMQPASGAQPATLPAAPATPVAPAPPGTTN